MKNYPAEEKLLGLLSSVVENVPFYENISGGLENFPVIDKNFLLDAPEKFLSRSAPCKRAELLSFLKEADFRGCSEKHYNSEIVVEMTSGATGVPFRIPKLRLEQIEIAIGIWKRRVEIDPEINSKRLLSIIHSPSGQILPNTLLDLIGEMPDRNTKWIHAGPRFWEHFMNVVRENGLVLPECLTTIENSGGVLTRALADALSQLGLRLVDQYGCREVSAIGYSVDQRSFNPIDENVVVEILDDEGSVIDECDVRGEIVITSLNQRMFPFIRYCTGDMGAWIERVDGKRGIALNVERRNGMLIGAGELSGNEVFKGVLDRVYKGVGCAGIKFLQICQFENDGFSIRVNKCPDVKKILDAVILDFNRLNLPIKMRQVLVAFVEEREWRYESAEKNVLFIANPSNSSK